MRRTIPLPQALLARPDRASLFSVTERARQAWSRCKPAAGTGWRLTPPASAAAVEPYRLELYDVIGYDWWSDSGIAAADVVKELKGAKGKPLEVHVNSPGGYVFEGLAIFNALRAHDGEVVVHVDALAASIASVIALAGDKVITHEGAMWMIHEPWSGVFTVGTADEIERAANSVVKELRKIRESIVDVYNAETGRAVAELSAWMAEETWMTADEALARGFTDEVEKTQRPEPAEDRAPGAAAVAPAPRPLSARTLAAGARARRAALSERFPGASPGQPGQPGTTPPKRTTP